MAKISDAVSHAACVLANTRIIFSEFAWAVVKVAANSIPVYSRAKGTLCKCPNSWVKLEYTVHCPANPGATAS
jgi:hypothetical protein